MVTQKGAKGFRAGTHARGASPVCDFQTSNGVSSLAGTGAPDRLATVRTCARRSTPSPIDRSVALGPPWLDMSPAWIAVRAVIRSFPEVLRLVVSPLLRGRDLGARQPHQRNPLLCFHVPERSVPVNRFFSTRAAASAPGAFGGLCSLLVSGAQGASGTQLLGKINEYIIFVIFVLCLFSRFITNEIF